MAQRYNNLSHEEWSKLLEANWNSFIEGSLGIAVPKNFMRIDTEFGTFIQVSPNCLMSKAPIPLIRSNYYGPALKVMVPKDIAINDIVFVSRRSKSGKSYIGRIQRQS